MARCKACGKFMKATANSTLKKHTDRHCPVTKAKKNETGETSGTDLTASFLLDLQNFTPAISLSSSASFPIPTPNPPIPPHPNLSSSNSCIHEADLVNSPPSLETSTPSLVSKRLKWWPSWSQTKQLWWWSSKFHISFRRQEFQELLLQTSNTITKSEFLRFFRYRPWNTSRDEGC